MICKVRSDTNRLPNEPRTVSCGCCTDGCVCWNHRDVPRGRPVTQCAFHNEHGHPYITMENVSEEAQRALS